MPLKFCQKFCPIFTSLSPNTEKDDVFLAFKLLFKPWAWLKGSFVQALEGHFKRFLGVKHTLSFNSGRSAFLAILSSLSLEEESEILLQAFTCNAAVNPILWFNFKPIFVDIKEETLNINPEDLKRKITPKSRAVLVQHTFGLPADLDKIMKICNEHNLILIEDCAHSLGAIYNNGQILQQAQAKLGTFGKASFFSFGRDKVISSVYGGMAATNDDQLAEKIKDFQDRLSYPSYFWVFQQLLHPILTNFLIKPLYSLFGLGRWCLLFLQKIKILSKAVHKKEKRGQKPAYLPRKMPNALAILAFHQFKKLDKFLNHQKQIATFYNKNLPELSRSDLDMLSSEQKGRVYMRYPVLIKSQNTDEILKKARQKRIFLNDGWRKTAIVPPDTNQAQMGYQLGSCPKAEKAAKQIINLPTHINISTRKAQRIVNFLRKTLQ